MRIVRTTITRKDGEYVVKAYGEDGKRYPAADYFTDDKADAESTARAMTHKFCGAQDCPFCCSPDPEDEL